MIFADIDTQGARQAFSRYSSLCRDLTSATLALPEFRFWPIRAPRLNEVGIAAFLDEEVRKLIDAKPSLVVATNLSIARALARRTFDFPALFHTSQLPQIAERDTPRLIGHPQMTGFLSGVPLHAKRLELLRDLSTNVRRVGVLVDEVTLKEDEPLDELRAVARKLGLDLTPISAEDLLTLRRAVANIRSQVDAYLVPRIRLLAMDGPTVAALLNQTGKPAIHSLSRLVRNGGLMSYEAAIEDAAEAFARQTAALLRGTPVGQIPIEYPRRFKLAVNLATAKMMNMKVPAALLRRAELIVPEG